MTHDCEDYRRTLENKEFDVCKKCGKELDKTTKQIDLNSIKV